MASSIHEGNAFLSYLCLSTVLLSWLVHLHPSPYLKSTYRPLLSVERLRSSPFGRSLSDF